MSLPSITETRIDPEAPRTEVLLQQEKSQGSFQGRTYQLLGDFSTTLYKTIQNAGEFLTFAGKVAAVKSAEFYADQRRKTLESYLSKLLGVEIDTALADVIKTVKPLIDEKIPHLENFVQPMIALALWNYAEIHFPELTAKIVRDDEIQEEERISPEIFISSLSESLFESIRENLPSIHERLENEEDVEEDFFNESAKKILKLFLPEQRGSSFNFLEVAASRTLKNFLEKMIAQALFHAYQNFFQKTAEEPGQSDTPIAFKNIFESLFTKTAPLFIRSFSYQILREEQEFLKNYEKEVIAIRPFIEKFTEQINPFLEKQFSLLSAIPKNEMDLFLQALATKGIVNLLKLSENQSPIQFFYQLIEQSFSNIRDRQQKKKNISQKHYRESARILFEQIFKDNWVVKLTITKYPVILNQIGSYLMEVHQGINRDDLSFYKQKLRELLWNPVELRKSHPTVEIPEKPSQDASRMLGNEKFIDQLMSLCLWTANKGCSYVEERLNRDDVNFSKIQEKLPFFNLENGKKIEQIAKNQIGQFLFKIIVILAEKSAKNRKVDKEKLAFNILELILKDFHVHIQVIHETCIQDKVSKEKIDQAFKPLVNDLLNTLTNGMGLKLEDLLPLPKDLGELVADKMRNEWLPPLFAEIYMSSRTGIREISTLQLDLHKIYKSDRLAQTAHVLSQWVHQFIPYFLAENRGYIADLLIDFLAPAIKADPNDMKDVESMARTTLLLIGKSQNPLLKMPFEFVREYVEAFLLKVFLNFSKTLSSIEVDHSKQPTRFLSGSIYLEAATAFMNEAHIHFKDVNEIKGKLKKDNAFEIPYKLMKMQFGSSRLHPSLNDEESKIEFYRNFATRVLSVLKLNDEASISAPGPLRSILWKIGKMYLFPKISEVLVNDLLMSSDALHLYLKALLLKIKDSTEGDVGHIPDDPLQRDIELSASEVIQKLVGLHSSFVQKLLDYEPFRKKAGKAIGEAIRGGIEGKSLVEWLDLFVARVLPCMHPGGWITAQADRVFKETGEFPKIDSNSNGDVFFPICSKRGEKMREWNFDFPKTQAEKEKQLKEEDANRIKLKREVDELLAGMIERQGYAGAKQTASEFWKRFQTSFNRSIEKTFGESGLHLKRTLDLIFENLWRYVIAPIWRVLSFPVRWLVRAIIKKYCASQATIRVRDIESPIHRNFMLRTLDRIVELLENRAMVKVPVT